MAELIIVVSIFGAGFAAGYSVRAYMSHRRRVKSRQQMPLHQN